MQLASLTLSEPDNSNTLPPKAAACNLLQHLAHFLRNPLQEPAVQEEKEKNNYWRPLVRPKGVFSFKCLSQMSLSSFYSQLLKTPEKCGTWAKLMTSLVAASSLNWKKESILIIDDRLTWGNALNGGTDIFLQPSRKSCFSFQSKMCQYITIQDFLSTLAHLKSIFLLSLLNAK